MIMQFVPPDVGVHHSFDVLKYPAAPKVIGGNRTAAALSQRDTAASSPTSVPPGRVQYWPYTPHPLTANAIEVTSKTRRIRQSPTSITASTAKAPSPSGMANTGLISID